MILVGVGLEKNTKNATILTDMKLFLVRHAEGENYKSTWQSPNTPLSSGGIKQAAALSATKRFTIVNKILSSNLVRAKQTADVLAKDLNQTVEEIDEVKERVQSSRIYGLLRTDQVAEAYAQDLQKNTNDWNYKWDSEEESKNETRARAIKFKQYLESNFSEKNILVVSHETFLKHLISVCILGPNDLTNDSEKLYRSINIENTGVSLLIFNPTSKQWKIWYINDYAHLG